MPSGNNSASKIIAKMRTDKSKTTDPKKVRENERLLKMLTQCSGPEASTKLGKRMTYSRHTPLPANATKTRRHHKVKLPVSTGLTVESKADSSFKSKVIAQQAIPASEPARKRVSVITAAPKIRRQDTPESRIDRMLHDIEQARPSQPAQSVIAVHSPPKIHQETPEARIDRMLSHAMRASATIRRNMKLPGCDAKAPQLNALNAQERTAVKACLAAFGATKVGDIIDVLHDAPRRMPMIAVPKIPRLDASGKSEIRRLDSANDSEETMLSYRTLKSWSVLSDKAKTVQDLQQFANELRKSLTEI